MCEKKEGKKTKETMSSSQGSSVAPLRPSLLRGNLSTNSVPQLDLREKPLSRSALGLSVHAAASLSPPFQNNKKLSGQDMIRTQSADSAPALKTKRSKKELREMARSGSPLVNPPVTSYNNKKEHKYTRSWDDGKDDDARSISSFTCSFADEFDSKHKSRAEYGDEQAASRQKFLDAVFRKLTQKTGVHKRESRAWAVVDQTIREEQDRAKQPKLKTKPHFLDLSSYISPVPTESDISDSVTPRPADFRRFDSVSSATFSSSPPQLPPISQMNRQNKLLRSRRSADNLGESRRLQREEWSAAALNSSQGAATAESAGSSLSLGLTVGQILPPGMSQALLARQANSSSPSPAPVPILPDWARHNNESLHHHSSSHGRSVDLSSPSRPIGMERAVSHDTSHQFARQPQQQARAPPMTRGVSGPVRGLSEHHQSFHGPPPILQLRNPARMQRSIGSPMTPMTPLSPQWPRSGQPLPEECISPGPPNNAFLNRTSISSAASDSSSGMSSVPQTPISRSIGLPSVASHGIEYLQDEIEMTVDEEEALLSGMGQYSLEHGKKADSHDRFGRLPLTMTPRPSQQRRSPHVSSLFDRHANTPNRNRPVIGGHSKSSSSGSAHSTLLEEDEGNSTVKANKIQSRPRASTTSSVQSSPTRVKASLESEIVSSPISPSRTSSLQKKSSQKSNQFGINRSDSVASNCTDRSSSSNASQSESLLSYTRGSPTSSDGASPNGSPHSQSHISTRPSVLSSSNNTGNQRNVSAIKAEDWASSIGRRFAKGVLKGSPDMADHPAPQFTTSHFATRSEA